MANDKIRNPMLALKKEPAEAYHSQRGKLLTSHLLADFRNSPDLYRRTVQGLVANQNRPAYRIGSAVHTLILEGRECFEKDYLVGGPINPSTGEEYGRGTKAWTAWRAEQTCIDVLTQSKADLYDQMAAAVKGHAVAASLLAGGMAEGVVRTDYCGMPAQARCDWVTEDGKLVDLKTCADIQGFEADTRRLGYAYQLAFYQALLSVVCGNLSFPSVFLMAVEKKEPFRCGVWRMSEEVLAVARRENEAAIKKLKHCQKTDTWPTGYEEVRVFDYIASA